MYRSPQQTVLQHPGQRSARPVDSDWPMAEKTPHSRSPGTEIVRRTPDQADSGVPGTLLLATDLAVGAASTATRLALRVGAIGWSASVSAGRIASALPGANRAARILSMATRPLVDDGHDMRARARSTGRSTIASRKLRSSTTGMRRRPSSAISPRVGLAGARGRCRRPPSAEGAAAEQHLVLDQEHSAPREIAP